MLSPSFVCSYPSCAHRYQVRLFTRNSTVPPTTVCEYFYLNICRVVTYVVAQTNSSKLCF